MPNMRPRNEEAEKKALIAALSDQDACSQLTQLPETFFDAEAHRMLFRCLLDSVQAGKGGEFVDVSMRVGRLPEGIRQYIIAECFDLGRYSVADLEDTIPLLRAAKVQREIYYASKDAFDKTGNGPLEPHEVSDAHEGLAQAILSMKADDGKPRGLVPISQVVSRCLDDVCVRMERRTPSGIPSGFAELDTFTGGFEKGDLIIVCGRPGMGKSSFAFDIATHASRSHNVAVFSLEMGELQFGHRHFSREAKVNLLRLRNGQIDQNEMDRLVDVSGESENLGLFVDVSSGITPVHVRLKSQELMVRRGLALSLIVVDYLQLAQGTSHSNSREQEVSSISRELKAIAKDLDCPVIALCQLNRKVEERSNKRPMLSDLRESGAIEQDADLVIGLYYDRYYNESADKNEAEAILMKQRNGPTGTIKLRWIPEWATFQNAEPYGHPDPNWQDRDDDRYYQGQEHI
mgnify:CR=1 FL=1